MALKQDTLLKQWMEREKAAVDYARTCDKRIAELEADATRRQNQPRDHPANAHQPAVEKHVGLKPDTLLKQWMEREKAAVDYGRTCDKRIAQLEADALRRQNQVRDHHPTSANQPGLEKQLEATTALFKNVTAEIEALRAQLVRAEAVYKASPLLNVRHIRLTKLEAVADMAQAGLAEESRILKKPEPALEETILVCDGEELVPAHWFRLKAALQSLQAASPLETKKARH